MSKSKSILFLAAICLPFARQGVCEDKLPPALIGICESPGALAAVSPETLSNPMIDGVVLEAEWADLEPDKGAFDWKYLDRSLGPIEIGQGEAIVRIGGKMTGWVEKGEFSANVLSAHWSRFQRALGEHLKSSSCFTMAAIGAPDLSRAEWSAEASEEEISKATRIAVQAFSGKRLGLFIKFPEDESGFDNFKKIIEAAQKEAGESLIVIASGLKGDKEFLDKRRPAGEILRALHGKVEAGIAIDRHLLAEGEASPPEGAETPAEKFRRAIAFGLWFGASHFQIDKAECRSMAARPDLLYLYGRLDNIRKSQTSR